MSNETGPAPIELAVGRLVVVDGQVWTVTRLQEQLCTAVRTDDNGRTARVHFDARDAVAMGEGLFGLRDRIEAPKPNANADATSTVAVADVRKG